MGPVGGPRVLGLVVVGAGGLDSRAVLVGVLAAVKTAGWQYLPLCCHMWCPSQIAAEEVMSATH